MKFFMKKNYYFLSLICTIFFIFFFPNMAYANSGGSALPWEAPLDKIVSSLTGPVALAISILAMVALGALLVYADDMGTVTRRILIVVLAVSFLVFGSSFMSNVFGISGAII